MSALIGKLCAGAVFGAALAASGVYSPWIIIEQMKLRNFHMLRAFMTATASSAILMVVARKIGLSKCTPRSPASLGWFNGYDGNIIGGFILGVGMTLTGACPGTVLVQVATGIRSGYFALLGGIVGGGLYTQLLPFLQEQPAATKEKGEKTLTIFQSFNITESHAVLAFEAMCMSVVFVAAQFTPAAANIMVNPFLGGLLIGGGQATSLALTGSAVGVSTAYDQLFQVLQWTQKRLANSKPSTKLDQPLPPLGSVAFAVGILAGALALTQSIPTPVPGGDVSISTFKAILGGVAMVFGARMAGGCTSGHGISGMSTLSISSFVTVASIFAGGMGLAAVLNRTI